ncbi:MAG: hypothetical protein MUD08_11105 [Cytophagales bacterium]|jgi:hypothetical protein|nr:hypothetical protein [Cytophagales bacterium]
MKPTTLRCLITLLVLSAALSACNRGGDEPAPDAAASIAGTYNLTFLQADGQSLTLPATGSGGTASGTLNVTRQTESTVLMSITITRTLSGQAPENTTIEIGTITVSRQLDGSVTLTDSGQQIGTVRGNELNISGVDEDGEPVELRATKR